jgi:hypothetical protein
MNPRLDQSLSSEAQVILIGKPGSHAFRREAGTHHAMGAQFFQRRTRHIMK